MRLRGRGRAKPRVWRMRDRARQERESQGQGEEHWHRGTATGCGRRWDGPLMSFHGSAHHASAWEPAGPSGRPQLPRATGRRGLSCTGLTPAQGWSVGQEGGEPQHLPAQAQGCPGSARPGPLLGPLLLLPSLLPIASWRAPPAPAGMRKCIKRGSPEPQGHLHSTSCPQPRAISPATQRMASPPSGF